MPSDIPVATDASSAICMNMGSNMAISVAHNQSPLSRDDAEMHGNAVQSPQAIFSKNVVIAPWRMVWPPMSMMEVARFEHDWQQMRDDDDRHAPALVEFAQELDHRGLAGEIHARRGLVEHEHVRFTGKRPRQQHPLLLPTREVAKEPGCQAPHRRASRAHVVPSPDLRCRPGESAASGRSPIRTTSRTVIGISAVDAVALWHIADAQTVWRDT